MLILAVGIAVGTLQLFFDLYELFNFKGIRGHYLKIVTDVLTLFVLVELARSLFEYFQTHKLRMTFIADAAIVFVIREVMIKLFSNKAMYTELLALSLLLLVLGAIRISSILVYQKEKTYFDQVEQKQE
jgi:uncharacterized membrane protein (DUF373 family)